MTTISVPLNSQLETFIQKMVKDGRAENKAAVVRQALKLLAEEEALRAVLAAERELAEGKILRGDIRRLVKTLD